MTINKGVVLAGGSGTRLIPLTKITNKHLIPIYDKQMIRYPLQTLIDSGIKDILIISGKGHCGQFLELLSDGSELGISLSYIVQEKPAGIADAIRLAKRFVGKENFVSILADNIFEDAFDFSDFREGARVYLKRIESPQRFGVARIRKSKLEENKIVEIVEKPDITKVDNELIDKKRWGYAVTGLYIYDSSAFDKISCLKSSTRNELEVTDLNNMYIKEDRIDFEIVDGFWSDAGTYESLYNTSTFIRNKETSKLGNEAK